MLEIKFTEGLRQAAGFLGINESKPDWVNQPRDVRCPGYNTIATRKLIVLTAICLHKTLRHHRLVASTRLPDSFAVWIGSSEAGNQLKWRVENTHLPRPFIRGIHWSLQPYVGYGDAIKRTRAGLSWKREDIWSFRSKMTKFHRIKRDNWDSNLTGRRDYWSRDQAFEFVMHSIVADWAKHNVNGSIKGLIRTVGHHDNRYSP